MKSFSSLSILVACLVCSIYALPKSVHSAQHFTHSRDLDDAYDYIVVGGGTSGLTVADRLTEDSKRTLTLYSPSETPS